MSSLAVIRANWTGFLGAPGYTTWFYDGPTPSVGQTAMRTFFAFLSDCFPDDVHIDVATTGDVIESTTGEVTGTWSGGTAGGVIGADTGPYSAVSGATVSWHTNTIVTKPRRSGPRAGTPHAYRLRGRTFLVPLGASSYNSQGQLLSGRHDVMVTAISNALTTMGTHLVVYSRPSSPTATDGAVGPILSGTVPTKVGVLRSRRD